MSEVKKKVFYLYLCIGRTPQFDIILPENKCVLYMGKNGITFFTTPYIL